MMEQFVFINNIVGSCMEANKKVGMENLLSLVQFVYQSFSMQFLQGYSLL